MNISLVIGFLIMNLLMPTGIDFLATNTTNPSVEIATNSGPTRISLENRDVLLSAKNVIVVDVESQKVLYEKNPDQAVPIASLTKLLTALVIVQANPDWNSTVTIQQTDFREGGLTQVFLGEQVKFQDLFNVMLVSSPNESAIALARVIDEEKFVERMNVLATELGMQNSFFVEPSGIEAENVASARDVAILLTKALSVPEIASAIKLPEYELTFLNSTSVRKVYNTNQLFSSFLNKDDYQIIGGKTGTGFIDEAGYCLALAVTKNNNAIIAVTLGSQGVSQRWQDSKSLVDWVFLNYLWE
jgi:D-alanyl-D-alanine endopeptidase (penicillin-binding protein 7)